MFVMIKRVYHNKFLFKKVTNILPCQTIENDNNETIVLKII